MFKLQSLSKYSPSDAIHLSRCFFHCSKHFLNSSIFMPFSASAVFLSHLFHISKTFLFEDFFHPGNIKSFSGRDWINTEGGGQGSCRFWSKLPNTQCNVGRCTRKSPIMKWANALSLQKNSPKSNAASDNNASCYTDTCGFLEHTPSGGSLYYKWPTLQKIIPLGGGVSPSSNIK